MKPFVEPSSAQVAQIHPRRDLVSTITALDAAPCCFLDGHLPEK